MLTRRAVLAGAGAMASPAREVFLRSPGKGTAVMCSAYYTQRTGVSMVSIEQRISRSDTIDAAYYRHSSDNGATWSEPTRRVCGEKRPEGMWRLHPRGPWVDPRTGRYLEFWIEGVLPTDDPLEGMRQWNIFYRVGEKGPARQLIHKGREFDARHPLPGVFTGKNSVMIGDVASRPFSRRDGAILLPAVVAPLDSEGRLSNPGGGYTYHDTVILTGQWKGRELEWTASRPVKGDPARITRGMDESTLAELSDGRLLCVMRGSNDRRPHLPGYRWISVSSDGGATWTGPTPWTYDSGAPFHSPSACSQLLDHSSGRLFWLGNITPSNPRGNRPRYPFVVGEVDRGTGLLRKASIRVVDDRAPGEDELLTLSNFTAREDRKTREICVHMTRMFAFPDGWEGDAMLYRIMV